MRKIWEFIRPKSNKEIIESYLANSISLSDLERRLRLIERGQAPIQKIIW